MIEKVIALPPNPLRTTRITNTIMPVVVDMESSGSRSWLVSATDEDFVGEGDDEEDAGIFGAWPPDAAVAMEQSVSRVAIGSTIAFR